MKGFIKQIDLLSKENVELNTRINYAIDNGATPENDFDYIHCLVTRNDHIVLNNLKNSANDEIEKKNAIIEN